MAGKHERDSRRQRVDWILVSLLALLPAAFAWMPVDAAFGRWGTAGLIAVGVWAAAVLSGAALLAVRPRRRG